MEAQYICKTDKNGSAVLEMGMGSSKHLSHPQRVPQGVLLITIKTLQPQSGGKEGRVLRTSEQRGKVIMAVFYNYHSVHSMRRRQKARGRETNGEGPAGGRDTSAGD